MEKEQKIYSIIIEVMRKINAVGKDRKNTHQNYNFRGIDDVYNEVHVPFSEAGLFSFPRILDRFEEIYDSKSGARTIRVVLKIEYIFMASDSSSIVVGPIYSEGIDTSDKATNKALAVAHKYAIIQLLAIPTAEPKDPENDDIKIPTQKVDNMQKPVNNYAKKEEPIKTTLSAPFTRQATQAQPTQAKAAKIVSEAQLKRLYAIHEKAGWSFEQVIEKSKEFFKKGDLTTLNMNEYDELVNFVQLTKPPEDSIPF